MIKLILKILMIFVLYCGLTLLLYAGRIHDNLLCKTDVVVFFLPLVLVVVAYRTVIASYWKSGGRKVGSPIFYAVVLSVISELISMQIKFGIYGT